MKKNETRIKKFLFGGLLVVLFIPLLQFKMKVVKEKELGGFTEKRKKSWFTKAKWFSGAYQDSTLEWFNENFGFHDAAVRLRNQVYWQFDHKTHATGIIPGKQDYLYDINYIRAAFGKDFKGEEHWKKISAEFKALQDSLASRNVTMVVMLAPGKASFYPEYIPDQYGPALEKTNYKIFSEDLAASRVNMLDFHRWFLKMKPTSPYPLYSKGGIHWSTYGSALAVDSLIKYLRKKSGVNLPSIHIKKTSWADTISPPDNDIGEALNLFFPPKPTRMAYPTLTFEGKQEFGLYVVGDSYFWQMYHMGLPDHIFSSVQFNYYNRQLFDSKKEFLWQADDPTTRSLNLEHNKVLLFVVTDANLRDFPWGFLEKTTSELHPGIVDFGQRVAEYEKKIRQTPEWLKEITIKAKARNISIDSMIRLDATWMVHDAEKKKK